MRWLHYMVSRVETFYSNRLYDPSEDCEFSYYMLQYVGISVLPKLGSSLLMINFYYFLCSIFFFSSMFSDLVSSTFCTYEDVRTTDVDPVRSTDKSQQYRHQVYQLVVYLEHLTVILLVRQLGKMVMHLDHLMVKSMLCILDEWTRHWRTQQMNQFCSWKIPCAATHLVRAPIGDELESDDGGIIGLPIR